MMPINRTGTQMYTAGELGLEGEPERPVTVYRLEEDVFSPAALASLEGKDITRGHPAEMLAAENQASYSKGHLEHVRRDGDNTVADLIIKATPRTGFRRGKRRAEGGLLRAIIAGLNHTWTDTGRQTWWAITWRLCREAGQAHSVAIKTTPPERRRKD